MLSKFNLIYLFLIFSIAIHGQCLIKELTVTPGDCDVNGRFFVTVNFIYSGTSPKFRIQGNGANYGVFEYTSLPVKIGPLKADCITDFEFVVRDNENTSCVASKGIGKKCCDNNCKIAFDSIGVGACNGSKYPLYLNLTYNNPSTNTFSLYNNGKFYGSFKYSQLPLKFGDFPSSISETYNKLVVCANDNAKCCDTIEIVNPCICSIYKVRGQVVDCNEGDSTFSLKVDFKHNITSDSFQIGGNSKNYGKYAYKDLPIVIRQLTFSDSFEYEFLIVDSKDAFCFSSLDLGKVTRCNFECNIKNLTVKATKCEEGKFYADIRFEDKNTSLKGFIIRGNGRIYDTFEYGEDFYRVGPLSGDCKTLYEFVVKDIEQIECSAAIHFTEPVCCDSPCRISELKVTEFCENKVLLAYGVNFAHTKQTGNFRLKINNQVIGTFPYNALPLKISNINFDLPNVVIRIFDAEDEACSLTKEYTFECGKSPECKIYDLNIKPTDCNDDNKFYAVVKFKVTQPGSRGFIVKINGLPFDTLQYGKDVYEIGPLKGNCETLYRFVLFDLNNPSCAAELAFSEKICCDPVCSIKEPVISFTPCREGKFNLNLNFKHVSTLQKFRVKVNGVFKGPFNYADLPVTIENLNERQSYEIIVWDVEKEACRMAFTIPGIECTTGTTELKGEFIKYYTDNQFLYIEAQSSFLPGHYEIYNQSGQLVYKTMAELQKQLEISHYTSGVYFLKFYNQKVNITGKFFKL